MGRTTDSSTKSTEGSEKIKDKKKKKSPFIKKKPKEKKKLIPSKELIDTLSNTDSAAEASSSSAADNDILSSSSSPVPDIEIISSTHFVPSTIPEVESPDGEWGSQIRPNWKPKTKFDSL